MNNNSCFKLNNNNKHLLEYTMQLYKQIGKALLAKPITMVCLQHI